MRYTLFIANNGRAGMRYHFNSYFLRLRYFKKNNYLCPIMK